MMHIMGPRLGEILAFNTVTSPVVLSTDITSVGLPAFKRYVTVLPVGFPAVYN